ncbi:MAG TPA: hypothetical protein VMK05_16870, partial [Burkholderiales bacterium]|nr:hypothetical protein [Burkholderiales bacterium]
MNRYSLCPNPGLGRRREQGQAFLATVLLVGLAAAAVVYALASPNNVTLDSDKKTMNALAQARDALIGRAAADGSIPGSLPCPDLLTNNGTSNVPNDGVADLLAGNDCPSYVGRLPWRTLGLPDLRDGYGERLWYALSRNFRDDSSASPLNSDSAGQLTIQDGAGNTLASNVIAIVFAAGPPIGTQVRDAANQNNVANYLEGENANGAPPSDNLFVSALASSTFN